MENRNFDKFYADVYGWILFRERNTGRAEFKMLLDETPNASFEEKDDVTEFRFNELTIKKPESNLETLDEFQDYVLECIKENPFWCGSNRDTLYSEMYVQAWLSAIKNIMNLFGRGSWRYHSLEGLYDIVQNSGFTSNLNPHAE